MGGYIEREAAIRAVTPQYAPAINFALINMIQRVPAADVQPVVRGQWEEWWPGDCALIMTGEEMLWMCSECTAKFPDRSAYCPNCGADMRTEAE